MTLNLQEVVFVGGRQFKEYLVILATKWDLMLRSFESDTVCAAECSV